MTSMNRRKLLELMAITPLAGLVGCTPNEVRRNLSTGQQLAQGRVDQVLASNLPSTGIAELDRLVRQQLVDLAKRLMKEWGDEKIASPREYVKYTDRYQSRAIVNFDSGIVRVETVETKDPKRQLEQAIITTLLTPEDPNEVDLLSDKSVKATSEPFLYKLVVDHQGKAIRYQWRAQQYAKHLMQTAYKTDRYNNKTRHFVSFNMVKDHQANSTDKYAVYVNQNSRRFGIKRALIYAIMEAESSFNPYAISRIPAYGLMQIVPSTAGRDAHQLIYKKPGTPTKDYLFVPKNNIQMGTGYLSILNDRYLAKVNHPLSREYCVICGYNTGSGNVLKSFDKSSRDRAFDRINRMTPHQVYNHLVSNLPYEETRRYLQKVTRFQTKYSG